MNPYQSPLPDEPSGEPNPTSNHSGLLMAVGMIIVLGAVQIPNLGLLALAGVLIVGLGIKGA